MFDILITVHKYGLLEHYLHSDSNISHLSNTMSVVSAVRPKVSFLIDDLLRDTHDTNKMPADTPAVVTTGFPRYCYPPASIYCSSTTSDDDSADERDTTDSLDQQEPSKDNRKTRPSFAPHKVARLKSIFVQRNYLSKQERRQLALELDMTDEQVKTWFQNKRTKLKKKMSEEDEHYAKLLYLNDLINGTSPDRHLDYQAPHGYHGYPLAGYPSLDRSPEYSERLVSRRFHPYIPNY